MTALSFVAAVAAMLANSAASILESQGSRQAGAGRPTWRQARYLAGLAVDGLGWVLSVVALRGLPVVAVQSVLAGTVPVTLLAPRGWRLAALSRRERSAVPCSRPRRGAG